MKDNLRGFESLGGLLFTIPHKIPNFEDDIRANLLYDEIERGVP